METYKNPLSVKRFGQMNRSPKSFTASPTNKKKLVETEYQTPSRDHQEVIPITKQDSSIARKKLIQEKNLFLAEYKSVVDEVDKDTNNLSPSYTNLDSLLRQLKNKTKDKLVKKMNRLEGTYDKEVIKQIMQSKMFDEVKENVKLEQ